MRKTFSFLLGPILFTLILLLHPEGLSPAGKAVLASTVWVAVWWITEAVELSVSSIIPIILFPLSGALSLEQTTASYGNPFIFLFMGGFIIGLTIEKWNLHKRIAYRIIGWIGTSEKRVLLGFMIATAFLSMWISNTATAIMMLPIGSAVAGQFNNIKFSKNLMLGIAYAASIGGMGTLIGTPPNIIFAGIAKETMGLEISFASWMLFATPFSILLLFICWLYLARGLERLPHPTVEFDLDSLGKITVPEKRVLLIFVLVAFLWISRTFIWARFIPNLDDTIIAIFGALLMFVIPAGEQRSKLMDWKTAKQLPWDVLLIFGGGLAIAKGFSKTDLTDWIALQFAQINFLPIIVLLIIIASINFLTEITSNTATASIMLPLLYSLGLSMHMETLPLLIGATLASSCAFMLPVATPPNAIVFSSGAIKMKDMMKAGFFLNMVSILLIFLFVQFLAGYIF